MATSTTGSVKRDAKKIKKVYQTGKKAKGWLGEKVRNFGGQYKCIYCKNWIAIRQQKEHDNACGQAARALINEQKEQKRRQKESEKAEADLPKDPPKDSWKSGQRKPSTTKKKARHNSGQQNGQRNGGENMSDGNGSNGNGSNGGGNGGNGGGGGGGRGGRPPVSSEAHAVLVAFQAWCNADVATVSDLKAHHLSMESVFIEMANLLQGYAQEKLIGRKFHPAVAQPIQLAADSIAGDAHHFTQSYTNFERIYAGRLEYERQGGPKPDHKDPIFTQVD